MGYSFQGVSVYIMRKYGIIVRLKLCVCPDLDCKIMKNRKFIGSLPEQSVRRKSKPFIVEMDKKK